VKIRYHPNRWFSNCCCRKQAGRVTGYFTERIHTYKKRAAVEQSIGWVKERRRIDTRYEKLAVSFLAMIKLAFIRFYLKLNSSDTA
jgi:transposase